MNMYRSPQRAWPCLLLAVISAACTRRVGASWWQPKTTDGPLQFQYQLGQTFDPNKNFLPGVRVYFIDGDATSADTVANITAKGYHPVCYFSAGSYEDWRDDAKDFLPGDYGNPLKGWPGEYWINITSPNVKTIMAKRMQRCKDKGFEALDPDNVDGYANDNGMGLTPEQQITYNKWLAQTGHDLGLAVGLKNDLDQLGDLVNDFDFFVNEQCAKYKECNLYKPAQDQHKFVWNVEYSGGSFSKACKCQSALGLTSIQKKMKLNSWRVQCTPLKPGKKPPKCTLL